MAGHPRPDPTVPTGHFPQLGSVPGFFQHTLPPEYSSLTTTTTTLGSATEPFLLGEWLLRVWGRGEGGGLTGG